MNKEIDWHGPTYCYTVARPVLMKEPVSWREAGVLKAWLGDRLIYDGSASDGAWPKVLVNPPVGWDERDALV